VVDTTPVQVRPLAVAGAFEITPVQHGDPRGVFLEWFKATAFREAVGHDLDLAQANCSVSAAGVLRGIHFSDVPPGQAKYVTCVSGAVLDVVVDIRVGSPTFGQWDSVLLDDTDRRGIYLGEGLGHAFMSLADGSTVVYLCSTGYAPGREHGIHPLDPAIAIPWPTAARDGSPLTPLLSDKDAVAPTLAEARDSGALPRDNEVRAYVGTLA
jgi:dTDP-4-dehydrorhamnose 3,5-epimerase